MDSPRARQTKIRPKARSVPDPLSPRLWWAVLREAVSKTRDRATDPRRDVLDCGDDRDRDG